MNPGEDEVWLGMEKQVEWMKWSVEKFGKTS